MDACTCGGLYCSTKSLPMCFTLPRTRLVFKQTSKAIILPKNRVSCYSHHLSQSALRETNWLFRVSICNPYLNPYLIIYTTTPPWNLTKRFMELRPSHTAPPWDLTKRFMELCLSHPTPPWNVTKSFMKLRQSHTIAMSHQPTIDLSSITISCQYPTNEPIMIHALIHTKLINFSPIMSHRTYKAPYINFLKQ